MSVRDQFSIAATVNELYSVEGVMAASASAPAAHTMETVAMTRPAEELPVYLAATADTGGGNPFFKADPGLVLWTWVVFGLTLLVLYKFAWKPILKVLDERETRITKSIQTAEQTEAAAAAAAEERERVLSEAHASAAELITNTRTIAANLKVQLEQKTKASLKTMTAKAEAAIRSERAQAELELKTYSVQLAMDIAAKLLAEQVDVKQNEALAQKFLKELK